jgi:BirA family transcriptional regulator, biotin operon repressor / biotin---[acetyl-CoA-carboxylase] ligase
LTQIDFLHLNLLLFLIFSEVVDVGLDLQGLSPLDLEALQRNLQTQYFGVGDRLLYLLSVESTNTLAMQLAYEQPEEGLVILTESQTAGKGRRGRRWVDVPGCNVLMSILFRPLFPPHMLVMITSLAVVDAIADICQVVAAIKWPNDVLIEDRKVAGILIETSHDSSGRMVAVAGIGVNVNGSIKELAKHSSIQVPLTVIATTLESACGHRVSREIFIARLLQYIEKSYFALQQEIDELSIEGTDIKEPFTRLIRERWRSQLATLGRTIVVQQGNSEISGIAEDVDESGELLLRRHSGELVRITWGDVEYPTR